MNRLRVLRAERRVTQMRIALKARLSPSRFSLIENDLITPKDIEKRRIARALGVKAEEVFFDEVNLVNG